MTLEELNSMIESYKALEVCGTLGSGMSLTRDSMRQLIEKELRQKIKEVHKRKIGTKENRGYTYWYTKNPDITRKTELELYLALYRHYYGFDYVSVRSSKKYSVATFAEAYLDKLKVRVARGEKADGTLNHRMAKYNVYLRDTDFGRMDIRKVESSDLEDYYWSINPSANLTRSNLREIKTLIFGAFDMAVKKNLRVIDPRRVSTLDIPCKISEKSETVYTDGERAKIIDECLKRDDVYARIILLLFHMPMRVGEAEALKWDIIGQETRHITICRSMVMKRVGKVMQPVCVDRVKGRTLE
ncbi:MAG: hypothetical protein IKS07_00830 [Lachnospiraceae bacterium]|nr:hypothetical protein [Lachnospiraceae bacterium]